jgi:hypothetical protein
MLYYVTREQHAYTINRLLGSFHDSWLPRPEFIRTATYETLFAVRRAPIANYVFTDLDRLNGFEIDAATEVAKSLVAADPMVRITNWPNKPAGRYTLLRRLYEAGLNSFKVWRLDEERAPDAFPVFIRREDDALGPESPLLHTEGEFRAEVARLRAEGKALTGRIAVQYLSARDEQGRHRKYGAFRFGDRILPQHLMVSDSWNVKRAMTNLTAQQVEEERDFVVNNPHADQLMKIFDLAEIDFGRADYCVSNGRIEVFEINTNPQFPRARITNDEHMHRRKIVVEGIIAGFRGLDPPNAGRGLARFRTPKPKLRRLRDRSLRRRVMDWVTFCRWKAQHGPSVPPAKRRNPAA